MASKLHLSLYTPTKTLIKNYPCDEIIVQTKSGEINPMPGHAKIISTLDTGVLKAISAKKTKYFTISTGILKINDQNHIVITSPAAEVAELIDVKRAKSALENANQVLEDNQNNEDFDVDSLVKHQRKKDRAETRIKASLLVQK